MNEGFKSNKFSCGELYCFDISGIFSTVIYEEKEDKLLHCLGTEEQGNFVGKPLMYLCAENKSFGNVYLIPKPLVTFGKFLYENQIYFILQDQFMITYKD